MTAGRHGHRPRGEPVSPRSRRARTSRCSRTASRRRSSYFAARRRRRDRRRELHVGPAVRHQRQHGRGHPAGAHGGHQVPQHADRCRGHDARGLRHRGPRRRASAQQDFPRLVERIRSRKPEGFTAMYDALGVYLDGAAADDGPDDPGAVHRRRRHAQHDSASPTCSRCCAPRTSRSTRSASSQNQSAQRSARSSALRLTQMAEETRRRGLLPAVDEARSRSAYDDDRGADPRRSTRSATSPPTPRATAAGGKVEVRVRRAGLRGAARSGRAGATSPRIRLARLASIQRLWSRSRVGPDRASTTGPAAYDCHAIR